MDVLLVAVKRDKVNDYMSVISQAGIVAAPALSGLTRWAKVATGTWLAEVELDPSLPQRADAQDTGHSHGHGHQHGAHHVRQHMPRHDCKR